METRRVGELARVRDGLRSSLALLERRANLVDVERVESVGEAVGVEARHRAASLDDPRHPIQTRIVDGGSGYLGQDEYTVTFNGLGSGRYALEVSFPSKPDARRIVGPDQNPMLAELTPGLTGPQLLVVRPSGEITMQSHAPATASA